MSFSEKADRFVLIDLQFTFLIRYLPNPTERNADTTSNGLNTKNKIAVWKWIIWASVQPQ